MKHPWVISSSQAAINSGTIGESPQDAEILSDINDVWIKGKGRNAVLLYLSDRVNPLNIKGLQNALYAKDGSKTG